MASPGVVLIVDSNPGALIVARNVLMREGHEVLTASNPEEGIARARISLPDLLLLDGAFAQAPVLEAFGGLSPLQLPIVVVVPTGLGPDILGRIRVRPSTKIVGALEKPFIPESLAEYVREALIDHRNTKPLERARSDVEPSEPAPVVMEVQSAQSVPDPSECGPGHLTLTSDTQMATLDADVACELIQVLPSRFRAKRPEARRIANRLRAALASRDARSVLEEPSLEELVEDALAADEVDGPIILRGRLGVIPLPHILHLSESLARTSCCRLFREDTEIEIYMREREVIFARQRQLDERFRLGQFLIDAGAIERQELNRFILFGGRSETLLGERLEKKGLVTRDVVREALSRQTEALVMEALRWEDGAFEIRMVEEPRPEVTRAGVALPLTYLFLAGLADLEDADRSRPS